MAISNQLFGLNLVPGISAPVVVHMSQGDVGTTISFDIYEGGEIWDNPGNVSASVHGIRQDGANWGPVYCALNDNNVSFTSPAEMAAVAGSGIAEIVLVNSSGAVVGSSNFGVLIERAAFPNGVTYDNDPSVYEALISYIQKVPAEFATDYNNKLNAEAQARKSADSELGDADAQLLNAYNVLSARMDEFTKLPAGGLSTAADAELVDIRNEIDGTIAANAGTAVRDQVNLLYKILKFDNSINFLSKYRTIQSENPVNGVRCTPTGNGVSYAIVGTKTNPSQYTRFNIFWDDKSMPFGMASGNLYYAGFEEENAYNKVTLQIWDMSNSALLFDSKEYDADNRYTKFTVPASCKKILVRFELLNSVTTFDDTVTPYIRKALSNEELFKVLGPSIKGIDANRMLNFGSMDDLPVNTFGFISSSGGHSEIPDAPIDDALWVFTVAQGEFQSSRNVILQIVFPYHPDNHNPMYRVNYINGVWSGWFVFGGGGDVINNYYTNSYTGNISPTITTDTNGWLAPIDTDTSSESGKTDMTSAIMAMLNSIGYCHLAPGIYYVSGNIDMPAGSTLEGCGNDTVIRLLQTVENGYIVRMHTKSTIKNIRFSGGYSAGSIADGNIGGRNGINYIGNRDGSTPQITPKTCTFCMIDGCWFENLDSGIYGYNAGGGLQEGLCVSNCYFTRCKAGINIDYWTEYSKFINCVTFQCYYACINNGGNNVFNNCTFHGVIGFLIDNSANNKSNNSHGSVIGCVFNHIDNMNHPEALGKGYGIKVINADYGFIFANCQLWYGRVRIENSYGIQITGCEFGGTLNDANYSVIEAFGNKTVFIDNCLFQSAPNKTILSPVKFSNCWTYNGDAVTA